MRQEVIGKRKVIGWGIDVDVNKRPYHPVHKKQVNTGAHWNKPEKQKVTVEILRTIEKPRVSGVFGTANPPRGLSGMIRRFAFKYSEDAVNHWMPLILADRIDFIEGLFEDIFRGKMPRILGDGLGADLRYSKKRFFYRLTKNALIWAGVIYLTNYLIKDKG